MSSPKKRARPQAPAPTLSRETSFDSTYYTASADAQICNLKEWPDKGRSSRHVESFILNFSALDFSPILNTSSYVNVVQEKEEKTVALEGLRINLADQTCYPGSFELHNTVVNIVASLWHCPEQGHSITAANPYPGAVTVGSTEACLLSGLALKFRWRSWIGKLKGLTEEKARCERPNLVISTCYQAAWEKMFKYMDVDPVFVTPESPASFTLDPSKVYDAINENTAGVICVLGNHYNGEYDDVPAIAEAVRRKNSDSGFQVGIHVDGASGGFIAPFQKNYRKEWDFRCPEVLSISASGHKFGESIVGTGLVVWRHRQDLASHVAINVGYLGGSGESYTLNFSRPASGPMNMVSGGCQKSPIMRHAS